MKSTLETLEDNRVKLSVEVEEAELEPAINEAFKKLAKEVRMPGFRPGKAPRRILEAQFGSDIGRQEALRDALPEFYAQSVIEHDVDVIAPPDIEITAGQQEGDLTFDAVVEVRPEVSAAGYNGLKVTIPNPVPTDAEVDEQIDNLRKNFSDLEEVERAAQDGDHVTIDVAATHGGEPLPGLTATDYDYEVGSGGVVPEVDENLRGASGGDELTFDAEHPDPDEEEGLNFTITVKTVKEAKLPEFNDEFAKANSEFETADELRADMHERLASSRVEQARQAVQMNTAEELAALVTDEVPEAMIENEINARIQDLAQNLQRQGMDVQAYLDAVGQTPESLGEQFRAPAEQAVKVDLALRNIAQLEGLTPDDAKIDETLAEMAGPTGQDPEELRARLAEVGQLSALKADLAKHAALEWLTENVELVDDNGDPIDRDALESDARGDEDTIDEGE